MRCPRGQKAEKLSPRIQVGATVQQMLNFERARGQTEAQELAAMQKRKGRGMVHSASMALYSTLSSSYIQVVYSMSRIVIVAFWGDTVGWHVRAALAAP